MEDPTIGEILINLESFKGVMHIGAHLGEELGFYRNNVGFNHVYFIEANPEVYKRLKGIADDTCWTANFLLGERNEQGVEFHISSNSVSSSVYKFGVHNKYHPHVSMNKTIYLNMYRLDHLFTKDFIGKYFNTLVVDTQGNELPILKGAGELLDCFDTLVLEYSTVPWYDGQALAPEMESFLSEKGFRRIHPTSLEVHGDAVYKRISK